ncbi:PIN domain-containing protein [[Haemophilus] felis]|uniref:VapC toxin family PIN domain ribonuclease n=1 Tax=[Haemophilus] felis TaxID=123822 RepID=A0A1T0B0A7_9PAST|nr:PIN domain-containing protein [[Haemophilus] felis]NBI40128.1 PIN domain-containing protein [[Haemophilus] felis]NBI42683.1 PIN domain-containing protein [[Haemophilus] felis]OOS03502.1 VapC toxin family PIN domain ribonuclease [[Haemophilus] felis]
MYLLDTNVISEIRLLKQNKCNIGVKEWIDNMSHHFTYTNPIILMELERGILSKERKDPLQGQHLRHWFNHFVLPNFAGRILPINAETAKICATLHIPDHAPENDAWIAASAIQHRFTLVTRNTADFERTGVKLLNPFK